MLIRSRSDFSGRVPVCLHADGITAQSPAEPGLDALMALGRAAIDATARRRKD